MALEPKTVKRPRIIIGNKRDEDDDAVREVCWKCKGNGRKFLKKTKRYDGEICGVCEGSGSRRKSRKSEELSQQPGKIIHLRGFPDDESSYKTGGFIGPPAPEDFRPLLSGEVWIR